MSGDRRSAFAFLVIALALATQAQGQSSATIRSGEGAPTELVGRWILIATIRNGEDVTQAGVTQGAPALVYDFKADGTFSITRGEKVAETGTWAANEKVVPKAFDHRRHVGDQLGRLLPGIYETGGDILKI